MQRGWKIAWRNLRRNRRRNLATVAAIAIGYAGLVVLGGYANRLEHLLRTSAVYLQHSGHVSVWAEGGFDKASAEPEAFQLDSKAQSKILAWATQDPRVEFATPYLVGVGLAGNSCASHPTRLLGVEPAALTRIVQHPQVRAWSSELAQPARGHWIDSYPALPHASALSAGLATLLQKPRVHDETVGLKPAPDILHCDTPLRVDELGRDADIQLAGFTYDGTFNAVDTEMVATFHATEQLAEDGSMLTSLATLRELYATDRATYIGLFLHRSSDASAVATELTRVLGQAGLRVEALPYDDERSNPYYVGVMAFFASLVGFITALVWLVLVLTVLGAMTLTIIERTREIGTWRALGFTRGHMVSLVVREALLLSLLGLAAGLLCGLVTAVFINASGVRFSPPGVSGSIPLLIHPSWSACATDAALIVPGVCLAAWLVGRAQLKRSLVDLLTSASG